jgi:SAM-dependent methyltransferase
VTRANCNFLDLGTGNGHFLFALREGVHGEESDDEDGYEDREDGGDGGDVGEREDRGMGWGGRMLGVDYSEKSVEFARRIAQEKGYGEGGGKAREVEFIWWDIMTRSPAGLLTGRSINGFDVVLDKGTFDAISLSKETDSNGRRICEGYKERVVPLIREGGIFVITSCNWTEEEVRAWFEGQELEFVDRVAYKTFDFGGKKGSTISSICFRRRRVEAPVAQ